MATKAELTATIESLRAELDTLRLIQAQNEQRIHDAQRALANAQHKSLIMAHSTWQEQVDRRRTEMERAKAHAVASGRIVAV